MDSKRAGTLCEQGHAADEANRRGDFASARDTYLDLLNQVDAEADSLQAYLAAKAALGLLLCEVRAGQLQRGQELADRQHPLTAARHGIGLLERGYATALDNALYLMLAAYLTSVGADDKELASAEVCGLMARATRMLDPTLRPRAALNWRCHLEQIHQGQFQFRVDGSVAVIVIFFNLRIHFRSSFSLVSLFQFGLFVAALTCRATSCGPTGW